MNVTALLKRPSIGGRLLLWFLGVALLPLFIAGYLGVRRSAETLRKEVTAGLAAVADTKVREIGTYVRERKRNVTTLAHSPMIIDAMKEFSAAFEAGGVASQEYIDLDAELRPFLTSYQEENLYYDLFLISRAGDIVFAVRKEDDFATNLMSGPYKDSELARAFERAATFHTTEISGFRYYSPSDEPAGFIAAPLFESDRLIGVVALQMRMQAIYTLAGDYTGLGETGETMVASREDDQLIFVTPLRYDRGAAFRRRVKLDAEQPSPMQRAVQGERGSGVSSDYRDQPVLAAWRYISDVRWGVVAKMDTDEAFAPARALRIWFLTIGFITAIGVVVAATLISRSISKPIHELHEGTEIIGSGNLGHRVGTDRNDEIGQLSRAFDQMVVDLGRVTASRDELEREIAQRKRAEEAAIRLQKERLDTLVQLGQMAEAPMQEITDFVLEEAVRLTASQIGYLAFMNEDETVLTMHSWSKTAMEQCAIIDKPIVYPVETTGLWGEAVRQRKPIITNDYLAPNPLKKGHPEGHVPVKRHMNIPVFDGERIVAVAGVGNKVEEYNDSDTRQLTVLMQGMWRLVEHRRAQDALKKAHDELEIRVEERTAELKRSNAELAEFAYVASHDLQEPLRMVGSYMGLLERRYKDKLDGDAREFIEFAVDGAKRMQTLIEDLLAYSRVMSRGKAFEPVDSNEVVDEVIQNLQVTINEHDATVTRDDLPAISADRTQLVQLFQNLVGNAIKFHGQEPSRVQISAQRPNNAWVFSVHDNGIGIDQKFEDRIFKIFQRLHTREEYSGTGIGLAVCKRIVDRHGGRLWFESQLGKGTTFYFTIPGKGVSA